MSIQQLLIMETVGGAVRDAAFGWSCEDPQGFVPGKPVGLTPSARFHYTYDTPLAALADGWHLLAPPSRAADTWTWWLVRDIA